MLPRLSRLALRPLARANTRQTKAPALRAFSSMNKLVETRKDNDLFVRHRPTMCLYDLKVDLERNSYVAPNASVSGHVVGGDNVAVWYGAVVRGDKSPVEMGAYVSIGDKAVVNTAESIDTGFSAACTIGNFVVIGAGSCVTSSQIGDFVRIGAGSVVAEGCFIEQGAVLAPGSVVPPGRVVPAGEVWGGNPVKFIQKSNGADGEKEAKAQAMAQHALAMQHFDEFNPQGQAYRSIEQWAAAGRPLTPLYEE